MLNMRESEWPASWAQMERLKFLSTERELFLKFEGFGRFGREVWERSAKIADAGFGPLPMQMQDGLIAYQFCGARPMTPNLLSTSVLELITRYCGFRAANFQCHSGSRSPIGEMLLFNVRQEFGIELDFDTETLGNCTSIVVDGRMQPHEWLQIENGVLKTDASSHGDDHFFPGPTDICWDLAGAIVEWKMDAQTQHFLVSSFSRHTGDDVQQRLPLFLLAYSVFRMSYCKMAMSMVAETDEKTRLLEAYQAYREQACKYLRREPRFARS